MIPRPKISMVIQTGWLIWLLCASRVWGGNEAGDFSCDIWTSENGLPDSSITAIAQTPDGYLWVGTYNGLARFDGVRFVTFDPGNTPALMHARVRKLFVDREGALWINTYDGSLTVFRHGNFELEHHNARSSEGEVNLVSSVSNEVVFVTSRGDILRKSLLEPPGEGWEELAPPGRGVGAICCGDADGNIWYRDGDQHLWRLRDRTFQLVPASAGLAGQKINCLATDPQGRLWVATEAGFAFWNGNQFQDATPTNGPPVSGISALKVTKDDHVWVVANGSAGEALERHWLHRPDPGENLFGGVPDRVGMVDDHHGGMWFYNYGRGLVHMDSVYETHQFTAADGFPGERVYCFFEDREGDWWAGLDASGLVRVRDTQFHPVGIGEGILAKAAKSVCEDAGGAVWVGMLSGGLIRWQDGVSSNLPAPGDTEMGSAFCVCAGADGRLWASAGNEDLYVREGGTFRRINPVIHGVKSILLDRRNGRVWVGTTSGLYFADRPAPEKFHLFDGILRHSIRALAEDRNGTLWAGTGNGEIYKIIGEHATMYHPDDHRDSGAIWSLLADAHGTLWIGTFRGGLLRFQNGRFTRFGKTEGLPNNVICQILDDGQGNLWLGSHQGIFRVAKSALDQVAQGRESFFTCVVYGRSDGLPSIECSGGYQPSACQTRSGQFWFTTVKGAVWIQPDELRPNQIKPPVVIEEVDVDGRLQTHFSKGPEDSASGPAAEKASGSPARLLEIPPGKHQIEIRYTGLSLVSPDRVQFRYKMTGVDDDWVQAGTRRFAQYTFLPPGSYRFQVIACNSDGIWNETGASLILRVRPHFYETWWFRLLAALLMISVVAGTVRHTATRRLREQMEQLERRQVVERERARIARDIHDDLGASLTLIAVLGDLAKKKNTPERLEKMSRTARQAVKSLDEIVWAVNPRNDTLTHLIDYAGQFATNYLRDAGIRCLLDVPEQTPAREVPASVRHNVFLVVKESLQNIVKHARATEVWLRVSSTAEGLRIVIEDNGCGFAPASGDACADGLTNMHERLSEIGGQCNINSHAGAGTSVTIEFPWTHFH